MGSFRYPQSKHIANYLVYKIILVGSGFQVYIGYVVRLVMLCVFNSFYS